ncbi:MAG: efflux RND transporter permease subunit [Pirellulales bacterium]|nr:efflux RND transporter permease subunit [Pirellulales bacterium]
MERQNTTQYFSSAWGVLYCRPWGRWNYLCFAQKPTVVSGAVRRLQTIGGVAQVFVMGGGRKQFQVLIDPKAMLSCGVLLGEIEAALRGSNVNVTGGYLDAQGPNEYLVRVLGRVGSVEDLRELVVKIRDSRPVLLSQVARVVEGPEVKRGDAAALVKRPDGSFDGGPAVLLTVNKQPGADTRALTERVLAALEELKSSLPSDVRIAPELYQQKKFIDLAVNNVETALVHGGILVAIVLLIFLLNFRTTIITLTAIPLSIVVTAIIFRWFDMSINTMTLGGLAVAIGELVDDAIVDVENIFRRLRENRTLDNPKPALRVVFEASCEIRNSIVFSTLIIVLVFVPLFALSGMEGRLFTPLGIAYVVSILASLVVSLTVTPVLSYWLLPNAPAVRRRESMVLRLLKVPAAKAIGLSLRFPKTILVLGAVAVALSVVAFVRLEGDFMPPFDEGVAQLNVLLPPGTSLDRSKEVAGMVQRRLREIEGVETLVCRTGRAELDEHVIGANISEIIIGFNPDSGRGRGEILDDIRRAMTEIPGIVTSVEQPLAHLISAMLSGVQSQVAIKLFGDDLDLMRAKAREMKDAVAGIEGVKDLVLEPQVTIPQLRIELDRHELARRGLTPGEVAGFIETAMRGKVVSEVLLDQKVIDLFVRLDESYREDIDAVARLSLELPEGGTAPLGSVARIYQAGGPNTINREQVRRRIVLQCNVSGRGLVDVVQEIQRRLEPIRQSLPTGYFIEYGGQFQSRRSAANTIAVLSVVSLIGMFLVLYTMFRSVNLALQIMVALPMALIGAVAAITFTGQTLSVASLVGLISLGGIATRNGILLLDHYLYLVEREGESWSRSMIVRGGLERLSPVLMTALTAGVGLAPLAMAAGEPGKEILYPVATVIIGGLLTSTLAEFLVRPALFWTFARRGRKRADETRLDTSSVH